MKTIAALLTLFALSACAGADGRPAVATPDASVATPATTPAGTRSASPIGASTNSSY